MQFLEPRSAFDRGNSSNHKTSVEVLEEDTVEHHHSSQAPASNPFGGNPFGGAPSPDQGFTNPSQSFNNEPDFSSTINISDDDLPF